MTTSASYPFSQLDLQRLAASEALVACELEALKSALASGSTLAVHVCNADGEHFSVVTSDGVEILTYTSC